MTGRTPVPAVTAAPVRPDPTGINGLLRRLDETVSIHQRWRELVTSIRAWRQQELVLDNDCARSAAAALGRVLREMGAWDDDMDGPGT